MSLKEHVMFLCDEDGISFYFKPKVFTNKIYAWGGKEKLWFDQTKAVESNRKILAE